MWLFCYLLIRWILMVYIFEINYHVTAVRGWLAEDAGRPYRYCEGTQRVKQSIINTRLPNNRLLQYVCNSVATPQSGADSKSDTDLQGYNELFNPEIHSFQPVFIHRVNKTNSIAVQIKNIFIFEAGFNPLYICWCSKAIISERFFWAELFNSF